MKTITDEKKINAFIGNRMIEQIFPSKEFVGKTLLGGKRLRIYLGVDPTGPHLHLGHSTNLLLLRELQDMGHEVIFLIGDFTAQIGDPTDKLSARQPLTDAEIKKNLSTFKKQAARVVRFSGENPARVAFNSKWLKKMNFADITRLASNITVQQMIARDMFQERMRAGKPIGTHEFFYPLMQGYDSVAMDVDGEMGGNDQMFNMLVGRDLMRALKQKEKFVITTRLLVNPKTGKKLMNKSEGGTINLDDEPSDMFGKIMAVDDAGILPLAEFCTFLSDEKITALRNDLARGKNPRDIKMEIATEIVKTHHGSTKAKKAKDAFISTFSKRELPSDMPTISLTKKKIHLLDFLLKVGVPSKSEARRLISQGAIQVNQETMPTDDEIIFASGDIVKIGKKRFIKIR